MRNLTATRLSRRAPALGLLLALLAVAPAAAQTSTGTVRGYVVDAAGAPVVAAQVVATNAETNFRRGALTGEKGFYNIPGLPPGTYRLSVTSVGHGDYTTDVRVQIGQTLSLDVPLRVQAVAIEGVEVVAQRVEQSRTPEVGTNITREQIESMPLNDRNFLSLALLAPGVRRDGGSITSGALSANNINVFVDGVSYKTDLLQGGVAGQDASKGNPFPQIAVEEFRVITQQYKAEYQKATSAIITATTKSGTNTWKGNLLALWQGDNLIEEDYFTVKRCDDGRANNPSFVCAPKPELKKWQLGASLGGPLVKDKLFFFGAYEGNHQTRYNTVTLGTNTQGLDPALLARLKTYEGNFSSPFRSNLGLAKLTWTPNESHRLELSGNMRDEYDIRSFGGTNSYENAEDFFNDVNTFQLKDQYTRGNLLNEAAVSFQRYSWHPIPLNEDKIGINYAGVMKIGGRSTMQDMVQDRLSFRNDVSYTKAGWAGDHVFKLGANLDLLHYKIIQPLNGVPQFTFDKANDWAFPTQAVAGFGDPDMSADNKQFGVYAQDDWALSPRLTLNLGVRWDVESNMLNNSYVTPPEVLQAVQAFRATLPCDGSDPKREQLCDPSPYITDGHQRPAFKGGFQPRVGFSYDVFGNGRTVAFGGFGVYYDRTRYLDILGEVSRLRWKTYTFRFSADGAPQGTNPTIKWEDRYMSPEGLEAILQSGSAPKPELFLTKNDLNPPKANQFSLGVRQALGDYQLSLNYTGVRGFNSLTWIRANRNANGSCCNQLPAFSNVFVAADDARNWYDALYFQVQKRYTPESRYGWQLAYTLGRAEEEADAGGVFSALDVFTVDDFKRHPSGDDERHHVTANWIVGLPLDFKLSGIIDLGSGHPYNATLGYGSGTNNCTYGNKDCVNNEYPEGMGQNGWRPPKQSFILPHAWAYRNVDLRLAKEFPTLRGQRISVVGEVFNVFNYANFTGYVLRWGDIQKDGTVTPNPSFGTPNGVITDTRLSGAPRRFQLGVTYAF